MRGTTYWHYKFLFAYIRDSNLWSEALDAILSGQGKPFTFLWWDQLLGTASQNDWHTPFTRWLTDNVSSLGRMHGYSIHDFRDELQTA